MRRDRHMFKTYDPRPVKKYSDGSRLLSPVVRYTTPETAWKPVARFLGKSTIGGTLGAFLITLAFTLYNFRNEIEVPRMAIIINLIVLALGVLAGAIAGLLVGAFTLLLETLIDEKLSGLPLVIATTAIALFMFFGL